MKSLKELFDQYSVPVDESGWEAIAHNAAVRKYNRGRKIRRAAFYGAAATAVVALVVTAITLTRPQHEAKPTEVTPAVAPAQQPSTNAPALVTTDSRTSGATKTQTAKETPTSVIEQPVIAETKTVPYTPAVPTPAPVLRSTAANSNPVQTVQNPIQPVSSPTIPTPPTRIATPVETPTVAEEPVTLRSEPDTIHPQQPQIADKLFFAPNAFSPNGDGINDIFYVYANTEYTDFELNIYSRNGDHVFQARHIEHGWNGRRNGVGELLPTGVYIYTIKYRTISKQSGMEKGKIKLIQ